MAKLKDYKLAFARVYKMASSQATFLFLILLLEAGSFLDRIVTVAVNPGSTSRRHQHKTRGYAFVREVDHLLSEDYHDHSNPNDSDSSHSASVPKVSLLNPKTLFYKVRKKAKTAGNNQIDISIDTRMEGKDHRLRTLVKARLITELRA